MHACMMVDLIHVVCMGGYMGSHVVPNRANRNKHGMGANRRQISSVAGGCPLSVYIFLPNGWELLPSLVTDRLMPPAPSSTPIPPSYSSLPQTGIQSAPSASWLDALVSSTGVRIHFSALILS